MSMLVVVLLGGISIKKLVFKVLIVPKLSAKGIVMVNVALIQAVVVVSLLAVVILDLIQL